ncbi:MAG TPA: TetR/AcrR family transcriptional regulator [Micromonosporaceae bacterium]|jgi:AcrR family transcriptional regulator|nr:TetR/AcrR family transcriptional regulator [Micromonosporaceae bacterium]
MARSTDGVAERRQEILRAAAALFAAHGYEATRVADIAEKAGVAKGLVFWYFESKEGLLDQLAATVEEGLLALIRAAMHGVDAALERLYVATLVAVHYIDEHYHLYGAINVASRGLSDSPFRAAIGVHLAYTTEAALRWQRTGVARLDDPPEQIAVALAAIVNELVRLRRLGVLRKTTAETAAMAARFAVHGVAAKTADADAAIAEHARLVRRAAAARRRAPQQLWSG